MSGRVRLLKARGGARKKPFHRLNRLGGGRKRLFHLHNWARPILLRTTKSMGRLRAEEAKRLSRKVLCMINHAKSSDRADGIKRESPIRRSKRDRCSSAPPLVSRQIQIAGGLTNEPEDARPGRQVLRPPWTLACRCISRMSGSKHPEPIAIRPSGSSCSMLNKVERHLESLIQMGDLRARKGPNEIRKIGLTKAHKVVTHDPA